MCQDDQVVPVPPYTSRYDGNNPLKIKAADKRSDNYFLIIGDWGHNGFPSHCQLAVAAKMKEYVTEQKMKNKTLLAILTVGDNFYWYGVTPDKWNSVWGSVYGTNDPSSPLYGIPWLGSLGNHDFGDEDPYAFCPDASPLATFEGQNYGCQQFNRDRNPTRPNGTELFWLPDYNYHYEIPEADVEFILIDKNRWYMMEINNWGQHDAWRKCGGKSEVHGFLARIEEESERLLKRRGAEGTASTTVILQHYPEFAHSARQAFLDGLKESGRKSGSSQEWRRSHTLSAYGHEHDQICTGYDDEGKCNMVLTGGGGGCCLADYGGFTAVHLTDDGGFDLDIESPSVRIPRWQCRV
jgi:hypothetical protein